MLGASSQPLNLPGKFNQFELHPGDGLNSAQQRDSAVEAPRMPVIHTRVRAHKHSLAHAVVLSSEHALLIFYAFHERKNLKQTHTLGAQIHTGTAHTYTKYVSHK